MDRTIYELFTLSGSLVFLISNALAAVRTNSLLVQTPEKSALVLLLEVLIFSDLVNFICMNSF